MLELQTVGFLKRFKARLDRMRNEQRNLSLANLKISLGLIRAQKRSAQIMFRIESERQHSNGCEYRAAGMEFRYLLSSKPRKS